MSDEYELSPFAAACYDDNSVAELERALANGPDASDMREWGLTAAEWTNSVRSALRAKRRDEGGGRPVSYNNFAALLDQISRYAPEGDPANIVAARMSGAAQHEAERAAQDGRHADAARWRQVESLFWRLTGSDR